MKTILELIEHWTWVVCFIEMFNVPLGYVYASLTEYKDSPMLLVLKTPVFVSRYAEVWWKFSIPLTALKIAIWIWLLIVGWKVLLYYFVCAKIVRLLNEAVLLCFGMAQPYHLMCLVGMPIGLAILGISMLITSWVIK